jgi:hypothetical protein
VSGFRYRVGLVEQNVFDTLRQLGPRRIEFYSEYLDIIRFPSASYQRLFCDYLHEKYADQVMSKPSSPSNKSDGR